MRVYKCTGCGIVSPMVVAGQPLNKDRLCSFCGKAERDIVEISNVPTTKAGKRAKWWKEQRQKKQGGIIRHIGL